MRNVFAILIAATSLMTSQMMLVACAEHDLPTQLKPPIPKPKPNDRCTLNGVAMSCAEFAEVGAKLYSSEGQNCAKCHDDIQGSEVAGAQLEDINRAIGEVKKMKIFEPLTQDERKAISAALNP